MTLPFFPITGELREDEEMELPPGVQAGFDSPTGYRADPGLAAALHVALLLGQPLLITGEPGTGKTLFARAVAHQLNLGEPYEVRVKSTTTGSQLFYHFDDLALFRDSQPRRTPQPLVNYLHCHGLGEAIIRAAGPHAPLLNLQDIPLAPTDRSVPDAFGHERALEPLTCADLLPGIKSLDRPPVVLIDELDKAPRDTPNDLLREIEDLSFDIPELRVRVRVPKESQRHRPIVIITSNSEKSLPEAFLRRCTYYHIEFPTGKALADIVESRIPALADNRARVAELLELFQILRERFQKKPGTSELLCWMQLLSAQSKPTESLRKRQDLLLSNLTALAKVEEDQKAGHEEIRRWCAT